MSLNDNSKDLPKKKKKYEEKFLKFARKVIPHHDQIFYKRGSEEKGNRFIWKLAKEGAPFYNIYHYAKKNKKKNFLGYFWRGGYAIFGVAWKVYVTAGFATGEWNPVDQWKNRDKPDKEIHQDKPEDTNLEGKIYYFDGF